MQPSPGLPTQVTCNTSSVLAGGGDFHAPAMQFPDAPLLYTAETTSEEPVFGGRECRIPEDGAAGLTELALGLGSRIPLQWSSGDYIFFLKKGHQVAPDNQRDLDGPGLLDTTSPGSHSNSVPQLSIRGWPGEPGTPSTELPGRPGLISASKRGLSHFLGGTPNDPAPLGTVAGLGTVTQPSPRASRAISVQSPPPKRA